MHCKLTKSLEWDCSVCVYQSSICFKKVKLDQRKRMKKTKTDKQIIIQSEIFRARYVKTILKLKTSNKLTFKESPCRWSTE